MWEQLKKIMIHTHDKAVVVEDGQPRFVVLTIEEYARLQGIADKQTHTRNAPITQTQNTATTDPYEDYEKVNQELSLEIDEQARQQAEKMLRSE